MAKPLAIQKIEAHAQGGTLEFKSNAELDPMKFLALIKQQPNIFRFDGPTKFRFSKNTETAKQRLEFVWDLVKSLLM